MNNFKSLVRTQLEAGLHSQITEEVPMLVKDLMTRNVTSCRPENNLAELAEVMRNERCGALPIVDGSGQLMGIITDRDICIALGTKNIKASEALARDVSSPECVICSPDDEVRNVLSRMASEEVCRLPVIDETGRLVGILSIDDIIFRAGGGRSDLTDREIIDTLRGMREERIHQPDVVNQDDDLHSDLRMPLNYEHMNIRR